MTWAFNYVPGVEDWRTNLVKVLNDYSTNNSNENWAAVEKAFVDGWAEQYKIKYGEN